MYLLRRQITLTRPFNFVHLCNIFHVKALDFFSVIPKGTCWARHIKSVDAFAFFRLSYFDNSDLQLFAIFIFEADFRTHFMTSAENSASEPPNLKPFWWRIPPDPLTKFVPSALAILRPLPPPPPKNKTNKTRYSPVITRREPRHTAEVIFRFHHW